MNTVCTIGMFALILVKVSCNTITYPGRSALLSYSPARGEFPVKSLFARGYFSYIDESGIARSVSLEPNPLLGVRVSPNGDLPADLRSSLENQVKEDNQNKKILRPIKDCDQNPLVDSLDKEQAQLPILMVTVPQQQELSVVLPPAVAASSQMFPNSAGLSTPTPLQRNPFLPSNTNMLIPNQLAVKPTTIPTQLIINPGNPFLLPSKPLIPGAQAQGFHQPSPTISPISSPTFKPSNSDAANLAQTSQGQSFNQQPIINLQPISSTINPVNTGAMQAQPNSEQIIDKPSSTISPTDSGIAFPSSPFPSGTVSFVPITMTVPGFPTPGSTGSDQNLIPASGFSGVFQGVLTNGPLLPSPGNPFLPINKQKSPANQVTMEKLNLYPTINSNPFLSKIDVKSNIAIGAAKESIIGKNIDSKTLQTAALEPEIPEQVKDTPEVEQAKREHYLAHELALARLKMAREEEAKSMLPDSASNHLNADGVSPQPVTSGPLMSAITEQSKLTESDAAPKALPST